MANVAEIAMSLFSPLARERGGDQQADVHAGDERRPARSGAMSPSIAAFSDGTAKPSGTPGKH
jgi:hypothetical protein